MPDKGRSKKRVRKTVSFPLDVEEQIQREADEKYGGDFTRAVIERLAHFYPEAAEFLRTNDTDKHNYKKR